MSKLNNIAVFISLAFFPLVTLLGNAKLEGSLSLREEVEMRESVMQWKGMKEEMKEILKRSDVLSQYQAKMN